MTADERDTEPEETVCPLCGGEGVVPVPVEEDAGKRTITHPPAYRRCKCTLHRDILANVERGMKGLSKAPVVKKSVLIEHVNTNLWITAPTKGMWFKAHLRHAAIRQPPQWYFKVVSDVDLITAWLASAALKGKEILDPDAASVSLSHLTLVDLVVPPQLLIVRLGVKAARNVAAPEVLLETLNYRTHLGLPTWIWDQPAYRLEEGHICHSPQVTEFLADWTHYSIGGTSSDAPAQNVSDGSGAYTDLNLGTPRGRKTLSGNQTGRSKK